MKKHHVKLVKEVLLKSYNREHIYDFEYGLALLACEEVLKESEICEHTTINGVAEKT